MPKNLCCNKCISDVFLKRFIENFSNSTGQCSYCGSSGVKLIDPVELTDSFDLLSSIYAPCDNGKTLAELFKEDWLLFPDLSVSQTKELLADIFDDGEVVRKHFSFINTDDDVLKTWSDFKNELMHENRFFTKVKLDDAISPLLELLEKNPSDICQKWYRARTQKSPDPYGVAQMGAPPKTEATNGRANPAGIPYLYLASNENTAISEVRPHTGEKASVAEFNLLEKLKVIDLRQPRETVSPFGTNDEDSLNLLRRRIDLLEGLGEELAMPISPKDSNIRYIPSQYLCEFIKHLGFDGVMYRSSVGDGMNLALFNPDNGVIQNIKQHSIKRVTVTLA